MFDFHHRFRIWNSNQHPFRHPASDFGYTSGVLPGITTIEGALDWILAVLYPNWKASVANVAALPAVGNTILDMRIVLDDGDAKSAAYRWIQLESEVSASWHKVMDIDFGAGSIIQGYLNNTLPDYVYKPGYDDLDAAGAAITGTYAGQTIYGGASANTNLTLKANSGDGTGASTGYVQVADHFRPATDGNISCGTNTERWLMTYTDSLTSGTLVATTGSITCASGAISFGDETLSTTSSITGGSLIADNTKLDGNTLSITETNGCWPSSGNTNCVCSSMCPCTSKS